MHYATDFLREHYLVLTIVEQHTFNLDSYEGLHEDIFRTKDHGVHHGANPGISMIAAIPYFFLRPAVDFVVTRELAKRKAAGDTSAVYRDDRQARVWFYREARRRGLDIRFGLVGFITTVFCMAPLSAWASVLMLRILTRRGVGHPLALGSALLFAFGTPVFLRTGYLNHNLVLGFFCLAAFWLLWNPDDRSQLSGAARYFLAGLLAGTAFLCDYSGAILMGLLGLYGLMRLRDSRSWPLAIKGSLWYAAGTIAPICLLWYYQWAAFGNPFLPPQHWMPPAIGSNVGYQGVGGLNPELLGLLLFDPRYGLFITTPLALLSLAAPFLAGRDRLLPRRETWTLLIMCLALILFFGQVEYSRIQWISGIRYLAPIIPFLFLLSLPALFRLPRWIAFAIVFVEVLVNWSMAMVRSQKGVLTSVQHVMLEGPQLPWLTTLSKMSNQYAPWMEHGASPTGFFLCGAVVIYAIWKVQSPGRALVRLFTPPA